MLIDLHTHRITPEPGVFSIFNRLYGAESNPPPASHRAYSLGLHPWHLAGVDITSSLLDLRNNAQTDPQLIAIGECGLDARKGAAALVQEAAFRGSIELAESLHKPVIIHCVGRFDRLLFFKKILTPSVPLIVHGFNKNATLARQLTDAGFYLSFGAALLDQSGRMLRVLSEMPRNRIFLETDTAAAGICKVYQRAAETLGGNLETAIENNFEQVFGCRAC